MKKNIYVFNDGEFRRKDNTIYFETQKGKKHFPIEGINDIYVFGELTLKKKFLDYMSQKKYVFISLIIMDIIQNFYPRSIIIQDI